MKTKKKILKIRAFVIVVLTFFMIAALSLAKSDTKAYAAPPPPPDPIPIIAKLYTIGSVSKKQIVVKLSDFEEDEYVVAYKTAGAKKWKYKNATGDYTITGLKPNSMVQIKAAIRRDGVTGYWSDTTNCRYMSTVKRSKVKAGKKCITVTWKKDTKATGYQILYSTNKNLKGYKKITVKGANRTKKVIKGLKKGKTYYVRVRPIKKYKGRTYVGILAPIRTIKVK